MKIKYFAVLLALVPACAFADDTPVAISNDQKVVASKAYVRSKLDEKQDNIGGGTYNSWIVSSYNYGYRPVVSLNSRVTFTGTGTMNDPFVAIHELSHMIDIAILEEYHNSAEYQNRCNNKNYRYFQI